MKALVLILLILASCGRPDDVAAPQAVAPVVTPPAKGKLKCADDEHMVYTYFPFQECVSNNPTPTPTPSAADQQQAQW